MMTTLVGVLAALLAFGFIVLVHELGHFLGARWSGIRCPQFAIGVGPRLAKFDWSGTEFSLRLLPLGGYVLMMDEDPQSEMSQAWEQQFKACVGDIDLPITPQQVLDNLMSSDPEVEAFLRSLPPQRLYHNLADLQGRFWAKSTLQKTITLLGGVSMNYLAALLLLLGLGMTVGLGGMTYASQARVDSLISGSPAAKAGVRSQDQLLKLDGVEILSANDFIEQMSEKVGQEVALVVKNPDSPERTLTATPDLSLDSHWVFRQVQQQVMLVNAIDSKQPLPSSISLPYPVSRVNGQPLKSLQELKAWTLNAKELKLEGPHGPLALKAKGEHFRPRAVIGISLAGAVGWGFEKQATSEVIEVRPGSAAARAGMQKGDILLEVQGVDVSLGQTQLESCLKALSLRTLPPAQGFEALVIRAGQSKKLSLAEVPPPGVWDWGLRLQPIDTALVVRRSLDTVFSMLAQPFKMVRGLLTDTKQTLTVIKEDSAGPIGIIRLVYGVSENGLAPLLYVIAILNGIIAATNLLPIPALDGARCLFVWWGAIRGRAIDPEKEARIHFAGLILLLALVALVSFRDFNNWIHNIPVLK